MATDNRISNLEESHSLFSFDETIIPSEFNPAIGNEHDEVLFLLSNSGIRNEKISFKNLKKSILDSSVLLTGDQNIFGSKTFKDPCIFEGGISIDNYTVEEFIYHKDDLETNIQFENGKINFSANESININVSGKTLNINNNGSVAINSSEYRGALNVSGDGYFNNIYILDESNEFSPITCQSENSVNFTLSLASGFATHNIDLPKTFQNPPSLLLSVEAEEQEEVFAIPYVITNSSNSSYTVQFAAEIPNDSYKIHTLAKPTGESSYKQTKTVSLIEELQAGDSIFEISYPTPFNEVPVISATLESSEFIIPYLITESTNSSCKFLFAAPLPNTAKLHVAATR